MPAAARGPVELVRRGTARMVAVIREVVSSALRSDHVHTAAYTAPPRRAGRRRRRFPLRGVEVPPRTPHPPVPAVRGSWLFLSDARTRGIFMPGSAAHRQTPGP